MNNSCVRKVTRELDCQEVLRVLFALSVASPEENQLIALSPGTRCFSTCYFFVWLTGITNVIIQCRAVCIFDGETLKP